MLVEAWQHRCVVHCLARQYDVFMFEQPALAMHAPRIALQFPAFADHAMARDDDSDRIRADSRTNFDCLAWIGITEFSCDLAIAFRLPGGDEAQRAPNLLLQ